MIISGVFFGLCIEFSLVKQSNPNSRIEPLQTGQTKIGGPGFPSVDT
jgi:hypothetical protein